MEINLLESLSLGDRLLSVVPFLEFTFVGILTLFTLAPQVKSTTSTTRKSIDKDLVGRGGILYDGKIKVNVFFIELEEKRDLRVS